MDVLMLTKYDWANTGFRFYRCLRLLGLNVRFLKGCGHKFKYPKQGEICKYLDVKHNSNYPIVIKAPMLKDLVEEAKIIHFIASTYVNTGISLKEKKIVIQHGGSTYRRNPVSANNLFNKISDATIIQCPDLLGLGAYNEHLIYYPVDTHSIRPDFKRRSDKILIGHFPSNPKNKGTLTILDTINSINSDRFEYIGVKSAHPNRHWVDWKDNLDRMRECDIIIETCNPNIEDKQFGEWGNTALEAAALGKIVVTNSLKLDVYKKEYGNMALHIVNNGNELKRKLEYLLSLTDKELDEEKEKSREWVVNKHSLESTATKLWERVYRYLI